MKTTTNQRPAHRRSQDTDALIGLLQRRTKALDLVRRGVCLLNAGSFDAAAAAFGEARELGVAEPSLPAYLAACWLGKDREAEAARELESSGGAGPADIAGRIRQALAIWRAGEAPRAVALLRDSVRLHPECAELHFQLGTVLAAMDELEEAELRFTQAITMDRQHAQALVSLALCCAARRAPSESLPLLQRAQACRPFDAQIGWLLAEAARAVRQEGLCVRVKATIGDDDPGADERGIEELSRVIGRDADFVDAFLSIPSGDVDETVFAMLLRTLQRALERQPEHAELHYHCGRVLARLGRSGDAIDENERAVQLDPTFTRALIELGRLYQATDRTADATTRLEQAIRAGAEYADVYYLLGNLYRDQGEMVRAKTAYRRALAINRDYEAAQKALAALAA